MEQTEREGLSGLQGEGRSLGAADIKIVLTVAEKNWSVIRYGLVT